MATAFVDIQEAQARLAELLSLAAGGTEVVLTEQDVPRAKLVAVEPAPQRERIPGLHAGCVQMSDDFDDPLPDEFWFGSP